MTTDFDTLEPAPPKRETEEVFDNLYDFQPTLLVEWLFFHVGENSNGGTFLIITRSR